MVDARRGERCHLHQHIELSLPPTVSVPETTPPSSPAQVAPGHVFDESIVDRFAKFLDDSWVRRDIGLGRVADLVQRKRDGRSRIFPVNKRDVSCLAPCSALKWFAWNNCTLGFIDAAGKCIDINKEAGSVAGPLVMNGQVDMLMCLIDRGLAVPVEEWNMALPWAASDGHIAMVKYLVKLGADIHYEHERALTWACRQGRFEVIKFLVENGADIRINFEDPLSAAIDYPDIVHYLLEKGADPFWLSPRQRMKLASLLRR